MHNYIKPTLVNLLVHIHPHAFIASYNTVAS